LRRSVQTNSAAFVGFGDTLNTTAREIRGLGPYLSPQLTGALRYGGALSAGFDAYRAANGFIQGNYSEAVGNTASIVTAFTLIRAASVNPGSFTFGSNFLRAVGGPVTAIGAVAIAGGNAYVDYALAQEANNNAVIYNERLAGRMINSSNSTINSVRQKMADEKCN
jgi:hypothetical protein